MQRTCACLASLWFTAAMAAAWAEEPPVTFARAGRKAVVSVRADAARPNAKLVLTAFGQLWGEPARVKDGAAEFAAPRVRVPVVFRVIALDNVDAVLSELVVYPDQPSVETQLRMMQLFTEWNISLEQNQVHRRRPGKPHRAIGLPGAEDHRRGDDRADDRIGQSAG